jgi:hypothetical protein
MRPTYLASLAHRRGRFAHRLRYRVTYAVGIRAATLVARLGPVELALRLAARWTTRAAIVWSLRDGRGWTDDVGDELDDLATTTSLILRDRLDRRTRVDERDLDRLDRITRMR